MANILDTDLFSQGISAIPTFTGATASKAGVKGFVPAPSAGDQEKFLKGDGTWGEAGGGFDITVPSFKECSDFDVALMLAYHRAGLIDLTKYWKVGDERPVHLSAMAATEVGESHIAQDQTFVILHGPNCFDMSDGGKNIFVIGLKNRLVSGGYINSANTNVGGWKDSARRKWCDNVFMEALPPVVRSWFKKFKYKASDGNKLTTSTTMENYFTFASRSEVFGGSNTSYTPTSEDTTQFEYYKTSSNRIKKQGDSGSANYWWLRSPFVNSTYYFCSVNGGGNLNNDSATDNYGLSPFGCV